MSKLDNKYRATILKRLCMNSKKFKKHEQDKAIEIYSKTMIGAFLKVSIASQICSEEIVKAFKTTFNFKK